MSGRELRGAEEDVVRGEERRGDGLGHVETEPLERMHRRQVGNLAELIGKLRGSTQLPLLLRLTTCISHIGFGTTVAQCIPNDYCIYVLRSVYSRQCQLVGFYNALVLAERWCMTSAMHREASRKLPPPAKDIANTANSDTVLVPLKDRTSFASHLHQAPGASYKEGFS